MFELTVNLNPYEGGPQILHPREYFFESCEYLGISEITVSDSHGLWRWVLVFDNEEDRELFLERKPKRVKSLGEVKKHREHLAKRRAKYKANKEKKAIENV